MRQGNVVLTVDDVARTPSRVGPLLHASALSCAHRCGALNGMQLAERESGGSRIGRRTCDATAYEANAVRVERPRRQRTAPRFDSAQMRSIPPASASLVSGSASRRDRSSSPSVITCRSTGQGTGDSARSTSGTRSRRTA